MVDGGLSARRARGEGSVSVAWKRVHRLFDQKRNPPRPDILLYWLAQNCILRSWFLCDGNCSVSAVTWQQIPLTAGVWILERGAGAALGGRHPRVSLADWLRLAAAAGGEQWLVRPQSYRYLIASGPVLKF
jgi:hypothetical protein